MQVNKNTASTNLLIASPISISEETNAIKPKAIRLKAVANHFTEIAFKHDSSVKAASLTLDKETIETSKKNSETIILHRPIAHVVPSSTLLPNLEYENDQQIFLNVHSHAQELNQVNCNQSTLNLHQSRAPLNNTKNLPTSSSNINEYKNNKDRKSSDGYIWRKYGQKLPKGSEFPRAYYRCTHPACPVKKMVDRSKNGEISEIIYRGDHNHPKRSSSRSRDKAFITDEFINERNIFEFETENCNVDGIDSHIDISHVPVSFSTDSEGVKASEFFNMDDYMSMSQKRKYNDNLRDSSVVSESSPIPKLMASMECINANNDGYNWRKYGHKVVKGKTYPRNYYRCSDQKCKARKYIDRASEDSGIFITTYKGKHEHE